MLTLTIAYRTLLRRKGRMALIGTLVAFGTFLLVFGGMFASSVARESRASIIDNFTGDFIVYSERSRNLPSPFAFTTPLPPIRDTERLANLLESLDGIESYTMYSQNYGLIQVEREGKKIDLPFIFYSVQPVSYGQVFSNVTMKTGSFYSLPTDAGGNVQRPGKAVPADSTGKGIVISRFQNEKYLENYGVSLREGEQVTLLGITEGGVNTVRTRLQGIFEPRRYRSVFDYINFMDAETYAGLYNFTGVSGLPEDFNLALEAVNAEAGLDESSLFDLGADDDFGRIDLSTLQEEALSGFTMVAVRLKDHGTMQAVMDRVLAEEGLEVKVADWKAASGFYAQISLALQAFIFLATGLIFLVVTMIFMNTLIINIVERTGEIGTMRALGADKSFVRGVFLAEALMLNTAAAIVAMAVSAAVTLAATAGGLPLPETVSQFLIGGGPLTMKLEPAPFVTALAAVVIISFLATVYPVSVATGITPLKAMNDR